MAWDPNQGQPDNPNTGYGPPSNPYGAPQNPYGNPPENPYGAPQNPYGAPPENPYGAPPYGAPGYQPAPDYYTPPPSAPLPLGEAIRNLPNQYIRATTRPTPRTFAEEMGKASWDIVWVQLIGLAIISAILAYLRTLISPNTFNTTMTSSSLSPAMMQSIQSLTLGLALGNIIVVPVIFFIWMGILYGLATAFGGQGRFLTQSYTNLLYHVPLSIVSSIVSLIPVAGFIIAFFILLYELVLNIFSIMAVHRLSGGRATAVVLIPIGVLALLGCGLLVLFAALLAAAVQH